MNSRKLFFRCSVLGTFIVVLSLGSLFAANAAETTPNGPSQDDSIRICHRLSGDSGPKTERTIDGTAWDTHAAHGDTKGECSGFSLVRDYPAPGLQDFQLNGDTALNYLLTANELRVYRNDTIHRSIESDSTNVIRLSKTSTVGAVLCDDRSSDFDDFSRKSFQCRQLDAEGNETDTAYFRNHSHALTLLGDRLLVSRRGEPLLYDFEGDTPIWNLTGEVREIHPGNHWRYFLSVHTVDFRSVHELRRLKTGRLISRLKERAFHREISRNGNYLYLVESNPGSRTKSLTVYDRAFEKVARWEGLPFHGEYNGRFSTERGEVYVPLRNGKLLVGDLSSHDRRMKPIPGKGFIPINVALSHRTGYLFLYGIKANYEEAGFLSSNRSRRLIVYDINTGEFLSNQLVFSERNYNFQSNLNPRRIRLLNNSRLALLHPNRLEIYRYRLE